MTISQTRAFSGLRIVATPTASLTTNDQIIGISSTNTSLSSVDTAFANQSLIVGAGSSLVLNIADNDSTGTTAWTAGVAQVETATVTAASGITGSGNATVTVTASGMTGSPKAISVALTTAEHTTATLIASAIAAALNLDADYSALFTATSSTNTVITTRKPTATYTVGSASVPTYPANDATLNVAIANGTCTGITTASTSADTTAGVLTAGVYILDGDGNDFEGVALSAIAANRVGSFMVRNESTSSGEILVSTATTLVDFPLQASGTLQTIAANNDADLEVLTITAATPAVVSIIACGATV